MITAMIIPVQGAVSALHSTHEAGPELDELQELVGGYIEAIQLPDGTAFVGEEAKLKRLRHNRAATQLLKELIPPFHDWIAGPMVVVGPPDADGESLPIPQTLIDRIEAL